MSDTPTELLTLKQFIAAQGLTIHVRKAASNPNMESDVPMTHWGVRIQRGDRSMVVPFSQGLGHTGKPELDTVLDCLASDANSIANAPDWLDWAREMGYETLDDAERARNTYRAIERQSAELRDVLGETAFETLLYNVERL